MSQSHNDRWLAYTRGELSLEEARAFEAELARTPETAMPDSDPAPDETPDPHRDAVRSAMRALDALEARHREPARRPVWQPVAPGTVRPGRRVLPVVIGLLAAAALALIVYWAWPSADPAVDAPRIADPEQRAPLIVTPATRLVAAPSDVIDAAPPDAPTPLDVTQVAATDDTGPDGGEAAFPRVVDNALVGARDGRPLTIKLATSPLGRGPQWRREAAREGRPVTVKRIVVSAHPEMRKLVTSGLLHAIVECVDRSRTSATTLDVFVVRGDDDGRPRVLAPSSDPMLTGCIGPHVVAAADWKTPLATFQLTLSSRSGELAPPGKSPGKGPSKPPGKSPAKQPDER